jgi:hypothetical protein
MSDSYDLHLKQYCSFFMLVCARSYSFELVLAQLRKNKHVITNTITSEHLPNVFQKSVVTPQVPGIARETSCRQNVVVVFLRQVF